MQLDTLLAEIVKLERVKAAGLPEGLFEGVSEKIVAGWRARAMKMYPSDFDAAPPRVRITVLRAVTFRSNNDTSKPVMDALKQLERYQDSEETFYAAAEAVPAPRRAGGRSVEAVVGRFLDQVQAATTRASYTDTLAHLTPRTGLRPAAGLEPEDYATVMERWNTAAATTWNRHLSALVSFTAWAQRQELLTTNPARRLQRRKPARRGDRAIPRARLEALFTDDRHALRERVLWRLLYETAARAEEILTLNIDDLDTEFRRARVISKGGAIEYVHWATGTARLPACSKGAPPGRSSWPTDAPPPPDPRIRRHRHLPDHRPRPPVLPPRRIPVQAGHRETRPAWAWVDPPSAAPQRPAAPGRRRPHRARTPIQIPPPAPGRPRPLRPAWRGNLRPHHHRSRPRRPPQKTLTARLRPAETL
ncbi:tyrosine-type recombinase/integrase [Streptosporangium canum]|uniref:tyrosine-type recombinase/integrase n=1 Tax=Streptosporangium canum TaxID=324952 RepID=UPI003675EC60